MDRTEVITLVKETKTQDSIGQYVSTETTTEVYAEIKSISRQEWFEAGRSGLKPAYCFVINAFDYNDELIVIHNTKRYMVYRTYESRNFRLELYCEEKGGI